MCKYLILSILVFASSSAFADCWKFVGRGIEGIVVDYPKPADRICANEASGVPYARLMVKLYSNGETIANLILVKPEGSRHWVVSEERTSAGSHAIVGDEVIFDFPFSPEGNFRLSVRDILNEYPAIKE